MSVPCRPVFRSDIQVAIDAPDRVYLVTPWDTFVVQNRLLFLVAPECDGRSTVEEIAGRLEDRISILDVDHGLGLLLKEGWIEEAPPGTPEPHGRQVVPISTDVRLSVSACGGRSAAPLVEAVEARGARVAGEGDLHLRLTDDYLGDDLRAFSESTTAPAWMPVCAAGTLGWYGPVFRGAQPPCFDCLADRVGTNREFFAAAILDTPPGRRRRRTAPDRPECARRIIAAAVSHAIDAMMGSGDARDAAARLITIDGRSNRARSHSVTARAHCLRCGSRTSGAPRTPRIDLRPRLKASITGGGHRAEPPEVTRARIAHHVDPITGIVPQLRPLLPPESGAHVWIAGQNVARLRPGRAAQGRSMRSRCAGKGISALHAQVGAIAEALERHSGIFQGNEKIVRASHASLGGEGVHPEEILLFSPGQYRDRQRLNRRDAGHNWIPEPFDPERTIAWSPAWSLTLQEPRLLPAGWCWYGYPECEPFFRPDSNGCAAGNTIEEAILQGFLELVERDSVAIWWYHRFRRPEVDLASFDDPFFDALRARYRALDRGLHVLDITGDMGIPAFAAVSPPGSRRDGARAGVIVGFGAHLHPGIAVTRATTEMNQFLPEVLEDRSGRGRPGVFGDGQGDLSFLTPLPGAPVTASDHADLSTTDLKEDVELCVRLARAKGLETIVLDQTRPEIGLHVVKVVVPGIRPFWARFAGGRLYDVPVEMGWLDRPSVEEDLNPLHLTI